MVSHVAAPITAFYAGPLVLLGVALFTRAALMRVATGILYGAGKETNAKMLAAGRSSSNWAEYTPVGLFLIFLLETAGPGAPPASFLHVLGGGLLAARVLHAVGTSVSAADMLAGPLVLARALGAMLTLATLSAAGLVLCGAPLIAAYVVWAAVWGATFTITPPKVDKS